MAALIAAGASDAWWMRWWADDAYASLCYAQNLVQGYGLTLDFSTPTEGYTNFLWTVILAAFMGSGKDFFTGALWTEMASFILLAALTGWWAFHRQPNPYRTLLSIALPPAYVVCVYHVREFATSGLETMPFALLANIAAFATWFGLKKPSRGLQWAAGFAAALTALMRADGFVWAACLAAGVVAENIRVRRASRDVARDLARLLVPVVAVLAPYWAWKWSYYHAFWPNTAVAKLSLQGNLTQGLIYAGLFFGLNGGPVLLPFLRLKKPRDPLLWTLAASWTAYVVYVGGDYMYVRFFVPLVPLVGLLAVDAIERSAFRGVLAAAFLGATALSPIPLHWLTTDANIPAHEEPDPIHHPSDLLVGRKWTRGITDERAHYRDSMTFANIGQYRRDFARWRRVRENFHGYVYFDRFQSLFFTGIPQGVDSFGLTSTAIASKPVEGRGRIGHEKYGLMDWRELVARYRPILDIRGDGNTKIMVTFPPGGFTTLALFFWDPELVASLRAAGAKIADPAHEADRIAGKSGDNVESADLAKAGYLLERYFPFVDDPEREHKLAAWLAQRRP